MITADRPVRAKAIFLLVLLCGQECIAVRTNIVLSTALMFFGGFRQSEGMRRQAKDQVNLKRDKAAQKTENQLEANAQALAAKLGPDPLGKLERYLDSFIDEVSAWSSSRPADEKAGESSMLEFQAHISKQMAEGGVLGKLSASEMKEAMQQSKEGTHKVENLNLFLCKRSAIEGYSDDGWLWQSRNLSNGHFRVKCTTRVNILNRGKVGGSLKESTQEEMMQGINLLKSFTQDPTYETSDGKENFPISLKVCSQKGGCQKSAPASKDDDTVQLVADQSGIFGTGIPSPHIPIPEEAKENLPRESHDDTHMFAVCYDQQDECDGMMWVPKNLEMCNGWFEGDDARATLAFVGDSIENGGWSAYWKPESANVRAGAEISGGASDGAVTSDDAAEAAGILKDVGEATSTSECAVAKFEQSAKDAAHLDNEEVLAELQRITTQVADHMKEMQRASRTIQQDLNMERQAAENRISEAQDRKDKAQNELDTHRSDLKDYTASPAIEAKMGDEINEAKKAIAIAEKAVAIAEKDASKEQQETASLIASAEERRAQRDMEEVEPHRQALNSVLEDAGDLCTGAIEGGEGVDCDTGEDGKACRTLRDTCAQLPEGNGVVITKAECMTKEQMLKALQSSVDGPEGGSLVQLSRRRKYSYDRRRRRGGSLAMDLLFPPYYYYGYSPYCYPWYGGYGGGFYAYPMVPNVGGYTFGMGTFHPGVMLLEGLGHLAFHSVQGIMWAGGQLVQGVSWGVGNMFGFLKDCSGDSAGFCIGAAIVVAVVVALLIGAIVYYSHCVKSEENCRSWWYRGGRLRKKMKKWLGLWSIVEDNIYTGLQSTFIFDGMIAAPDSCMSHLQWGRNWAMMNDETWQSQTHSNTTLMAQTRPAEGGP